MNRVIFTLTVFGCVCVAVGADADLSTISDRDVWRVHNREVQFIQEAGKKFVRLDARRNHGVAWLLGSDFKEGTIEVELRGKNKPQQSFIGVAFHGVDDNTHEVVYFRPFNFKSEDAVRRSRAVQYISWPTFTWERLRAESPGKYEQRVLSVPDPDRWFRARIVVGVSKVSVFVNDSTTPCL